MNRKKLSVLIFLVFVFLLAFLLFKKLEISPKTPFVQIGKTKIQVTLAQTEAERTQGLSGTKSLGENQGMLFVFEEPARYGFWMKDMNYSLDLIWIDEKNQIVDITENVPPESFPKIFQPAREVKYVLEVNALFSRQHNIRVGDFVKLP